MSARRAGVIVVLAVAVLLGLVTSGRVVAQITAERVVMTPADGTLTTRFLFSGSGFTPGRTVSVRITTPDGVERRFRTDEDIEIVWLVLPDGTFSLEMVPAQRFPGAGPGRWQALFCGFEATTCQLLTFDVSP